MRASKAINIIEAQKNSIKSIDGENYHVWMTHTLSCVRNIFSESSEEYVYLKNFYENFPPLSPESYANNLKAPAEIFLNNCVGTIKNFGVKKKEWKHILITTHPAIFWSVFTAVVAFSFWVGTLVGDPTDKSNKAANKQSNNKNKSNIVDTTQS